MKGAKIVLVIAAGLLPGSVIAQQPVQWKAVTAASTAAPGGKMTVTLSATIEDGWYIYSLTQGKGGPVPLAITMPVGQPFVIGGEIKAPTPDWSFDQNFGIDVERHSEKPEFVVPIAVATDAKPGQQTLKVHARYQVCNARVCLPQQTEKLSVPVTIAGAKQARP
jgi:DsbC/DsbD-like thiol-disulfide interchange protein